ncbi:MAG: MOSC domain-containing protein [Myxococcales bacterium]|nr:MOSC domain-containing protein [Myxococcales bacterium]
MSQEAESEAGGARHLDREALEAGLDEIRRAPAERGRLEMIVRRPEAGTREVLAEGTLDPREGLVGDDWRRRGSRHTPDGSADPQMQLTVMSARAAALVAQARERWPLAGDQLYVDLDLSEANLPPGTRLALGDACIEVTAEPHAGCRKFVERFGLAAMKFVNSEVGRALHLRGVNARVVEPGTVRVGDAVTRLPKG